MLPILPKAAPHSPSLALMPMKWEQGLLIQAPNTDSSQTRNQIDCLRNLPFLLPPPGWLSWAPSFGSARDYGSGEVGWEEQEAALGFPPAGLPRPLHVLSLLPPPPADLVI